MNCSLHLEISARQNVARAFEVRGETGFAPDDDDEDKEEEAAPNNDMRNAVAALGASCFYQVLPSRSV